MRIGRLGGLDIRLSPFFPLLVALLLWWGHREEVLVYLLTLGVHEASHILIADRLGLGRGELEIWPLGGVTRLEELPNAEPTAEALVSLAGPVGNLVLLAAVLFLRDRGILGPWSWQLMLTANLGMAFLNLLPVYPLDGGRLYRAILVGERGWWAATARAVLVGRILAGAFLLGGLVAMALGAGAVWAVFGLFLLFAVNSEAEPAGYRFFAELLGRPRTARRALTLVARPETTIGEILREFRPHRYHLVLVIDAVGRPFLRLNEAEIAEALRRYGPGLRLGEIRGGD